MKMKKILAFSALVAAAVIFGFAYIANAETCTTECPSVSVIFDVQNDSGGELTSNDFGFIIDWPTYKSVADGNKKFTHTSDSQVAYPISYSVRVYGGNSTPHSNTEWQPKVSLYKTYWTERNGHVSLSDNCTGILNLNETVECTITITDGDSSYGYHYNLLSPGHYTETQTPLTTSCTYKNRAKFYGDKLLEAPKPDPLDNIAGCSPLETEEQLTKKSEDAAKALEQQQLLTEATQTAQSQLTASTPQHIVEYVPVYVPDTVYTQIVSLPIATTTVERPVKQKTITLKKKEIASTTNQKKDSATTTIIATTTISELDEELVIDIPETVFTKVVNFLKWLFRI